jgi:hypothetical protein
MADFSSPTLPTDGSQSRIPAALLFGATLLEIVGMAHHPSVQAPDISVVLERIAQLARLSEWIHGVLIAAMLCVAYGLLEFSRLRGWSRPWIRAGSIAYGIGAIMMMGAALVSGFILPGIVVATPHTTPTDLAINAQLLVLCRVLNQSCANAATVGLSAGILCWSIDLMRERGGLRLLSGLGLLVGILPAAGLVWGGVHLNVRGMSEVVWLQALWNCGVAAALWSRC